MSAQYSSDEDSSGSQSSGEQAQKGKSGLLQLRELTVLEKKQKIAALAKQRDNIVQPQVVMGREFKGQAFISKPSKIIFKDFTLGKIHQQVIQLTNVSFSFNSFKLLPLNEKIRDFFDITYTPPGRMSAGMSCPVKIKFRPEVDEDIFDYFPILSATGEIHIPIECTCKKAIVNVMEKEIDFG